jgi:hypothetical protein
MVHDLANLCGMKRPCLDFLVFLAPIYSPFIQQIAWLTQLITSYCGRWNLNIRN